MNITKRKRAISPRSGGKDLRDEWMIRHMNHNKAYVFACETGKGEADEELLQRLQDRFHWYRESWAELPRLAVKNGLNATDLKASGHIPLSIDIEVAALCDLACPFCFRQHILTPDKIIDSNRCFRLIEQAAELGVPSIKFNWRGEPLLNPRLPEYIKYAKQCGILDVIINTNATKLDEAMSRRLIEAGLDLIIYSFDGGTRESYERMRPGRFKTNNFDDVYKNIRQFKAIRDRMNSPLPYTKIQMILTAETFSEQDAFVELFESYVDDVSVKQYTERGANLEELSGDARDQLARALEENGMPEETPFMRDMDGTMYIATGRIPCEQPFQRLLVTYDGRVGMCCYDWGAQHPVGYVDSTAFEDPNSDIDVVDTKVKSNAKGFEFMSEAQMPAQLNEPNKATLTLDEIWHGPEIEKVRSAHINNCANKIKVCQTCTFKETFEWKRVERHND
jgi:MoaA/NifB/PqqE/SkfB family radical SAM enzyme